MGLAVHPGPLAVLCIGLWHRVELSDGPRRAPRASGGLWHRVQLSCAAEWWASHRSQSLWRSLGNKWIGLWSQSGWDEESRTVPSTESNARCPSHQSLYWATHAQWWCHSFIHIKKWKTERNVNYVWGNGIWPQTFMWYLEINILKGQPGMDKGITLWRYTWLCA